MSHQWVRFVRHEMVPAFQAVGWELASSLNGSPHGEWSTIMRWPGEVEPGDEPPEPDIEHQVVALAQTDLGVE